MPIAIILIILVLILIWYIQIQKHKQKKLLKQERISREDYKINMATYKKYDILIAIIAIGSVALVILTKLKIIG